MNGIREWHSNQGAVMTIAALSWPGAIVAVALIWAVAFLLAVVVWSIFRTGQTAIQHDERAR